MNVLFLTILLIHPLLAWTQTEEVAAINRIVKSYKPQKQLLLRFERVDTITYGDQRIMGNHYYYLDSKVRQLSSIAVVENGNQPKDGLQIIYTFSNDRLIKITYLPARSVCKRCMAEYYFQQEKLFHKNESTPPPIEIEALFQEAQNLKAKAPKRKPCGHYEGEKCTHE